VLDADFVTGSRLFLELEPMQIETYLLKKAGQLTCRVAPTLRDTILIEAVARPGDDGPLSMPEVCVGLAAIHGGSRLRQALACLLMQTYPRHLYEIIVVHDGRHDDVRAIVDEAQRSSDVRVREVGAGAGEGPLARAAVLDATAAPIIGHTDDYCSPPGDWIEAAVLRFDEDTAVVSGPVFAGPESHPKYMEVPGTRPDPAERERWRTDLFPIANTFYRRSAITAVGGFDRKHARGDTSALGWDTEVAWRLHRAGWQVRFLETLPMSTVFRPGAGRSFGAQVRRASELPALYSEVPEVRAQLVAGVFASRQSMYFDMMLAGAAVAAARRNPRWLLVAVPWLGIVSRRFGVWPPNKWKPSAKVIARIGMLNLLWLMGFIIGSIRARKVVL
jgi:cellulose synthase/poly-beta-1,6-N-acetylglucosamine synthase-like glycosyltransferase